MNTPLNIQSTYQRLSDEDLVHRFVNRNEPDTFGELYRRYGHLVLGLCLKYLKDLPAAQDATQQIFIKTMEDLHRFEVQTFKAWIYQVAKNYCLMQLRKNQPISYGENNQWADVENDEYWHHKVEQEKLFEQLEAGLQQLNEEQRECLRLFYFDKKNYTEIAEHKNMTMMKVKSAIQNGKRNLKIMLSKKNGVS